MATSAGRSWGLTLLRIALLAVAYAALGLPALQLATPPGYAAPIFPPAGIMLAAGLVYGYRVLPAAFFGSLLLRLIAYGGLAGAHVGQPWVGIVIALAAMLQATLGTRLARRLCGETPALDTPATIVRFVLLSPVVALVSASISAPALLKWGIATPASGFFYWWNWWVGDTLGILVGVPITLALLGQPREHWQARRWTVAIPLLAMIALAALITGMVARWEEQRIEGRFAYDAQKLVNAFRSELRLDVLAVQVAAQSGSPLGGGASSPRWLEEAPSIRSVGRVSVAEAAGSTARPDMADVSGWREADQALLGTETARAALQHALASGEVSASEPWTIGSGDTQQAEFLVWIPDAAAPPGVARRTLVYAVLNVNRLDPRLLVDDAAALAICWVDRTGEASHRIAGPRDCERPVRGRALKQETAIALWGRDWLIRVVATPGYLGTMHGWGTWAFSAVTVLAIGAIGVFLLLLTGRAQTISRLVLYRTAELEREKAALRSSEELLRNILDHASVGITVYGPDGRMLRVNPSLCQITGYRADELVAMRCTDLIHPDDRTDEDGWPRGDARPSGPDEGRQVRYVRKDGSVVDVQVRVALGRQQQGGPDYAVAVIEDITERVRLRQAERARLVAEEATRAKDDFLSRMSHELRTPLNGILGFAQILRGDKGSPLPPTQRRQVEHIETAGWHLLAIIDDLLDLSRIEAGAMRLSLEPVDLEAVVSETVAMVAGAAAQQRIDVRVRIEAEARRVRADATRLKQVLVNLVSNALKYNIGGGTVAIEARSAEPEQIVLTVRDTGQGMSPLQLSELFQPFNRLGRDRGPVPGTGIGLVVTKKLIELMGGRIDVSSVEGQGSTFAVTLAAAHADPVVRPPAAGTRDGAGRYGERRVAYIEDNPLNAEVMRALLSVRPQVRLDVFARAEDGLAAIRAQGFDLLLLDMSLPDARGIDVLRRLKDDPATRPMPVIVVSADTLADHLREALRAGALAYLAKPIEREHALEQIDRVLESVIA